MQDATIIRISPRTLSNAVPGTTARWWERRMARILELRDAEGRPLARRVGRRYLGDLEAILRAILDGALDEQGAA